jgi:RNA polymerase II subunit A small phosphatase-like protein
MDDRPLLVLDLDETLLHARELPLPIEAQFQVPPYYVYLRPGLVGFLGRIAQDFRMAVWTSSSPSYAEAICELILPPPARLEFIWAGDRCTPTRNIETDTWCHAKPLRKLEQRGYDLARVLVIDDSPEKHTRNYGNLVQVTPFFGDPADDELAHLAPYLGELARAGDVRTVEKRSWRSRINSGR